MAASLLHIRHQGPILAALGRTMASVVQRKLGAKQPKPGPVPSEWIRQQVPARDPVLVADFVRFCGGDPSAYGNNLPPQLFPQWTFGIVAKTLANQPYPLERALNGGCTMTMHRPIPRDSELVMAARLVSVEVTERRIRFHQKLLTGPIHDPEALEVDFFPVIPKRGGAKKTARAQSATAEAAPVLSELGRWGGSWQDGFDFAVLTGDFNPIHWIPLAARAAGFKRTILHGFATMSRAIEVYQRERLNGDPTRLKSVDVRFTRPLVLPADVGVYSDEEGKLIVADDATARPYLAATLESRGV